VTSPPLHFFENKPKPLTFGSYRVFSAGNACSTYEDLLYDKELVRSLGTDLFEAAPDPILLVGSTGEVLAANQQAELCFGYSRQEFSRQTVEKLLPETHRSEHAQHRASYQQRPHTRLMGPGLSLTALRKDGTIFPVEISLSPLQSKQGSITICIIRDITERKATEEKLRFLSSHDLLTDLYNRSYFELEVSRIDKDRQHSVSVVMIDVNGLKLANDVEGHAAGDLLLQRTAAVLRKAFRSEDLVARIGGDEFAVVLPVECDPKELHERLHQELQEHNQAQAKTLSFAVGVAIAPPQTTIAEALREADTNMYQDKRAQGKTRGA
jgi:diguanylate cyclase (GGDEF)-like protein/PAS domain S-box-containing protein